MKTAVVILTCLTYLPYGVECLQCNAGLLIRIDGKVLTNSLYQQTCPEEAGQSCLTADAVMSVNELLSEVYVGACATKCKDEARRGCREILMSMQEGEESEEEEQMNFNVSKCDVSCCDSGDFCNAKPENPEYRDPDDRSNARCFSGTRLTSPSEGVLNDNTRAVTCPPNDVKKFGSEISCLRATVDMSGGTAETLGTMVLTRCQPTIVCESFTCDVVMENIPDNVRGMVSSCETSCCQGDFCNHAQSLTPVRPLTATVTFVSWYLVWMTLF